MKVIDYIEKLYYGTYDYYDTKFRVKDNSIIDKFTMNTFCQRFALTEEILGMEVEIIEDTPKDTKIQPITDEVWKVLKSEMINKINEIIDKVNNE